MDVDLKEEIESACCVRKDQNGDHWRAAVNKVIKPQTPYKHIICIFYFGILHPVARALSRLSGKNRPSQQLFSSMKRVSKKIE
jgi:hypothetical protein